MQGIIFIFQNIQYSKCRNTEICSQPYLLKYQSPPWCNYLYQKDSRSSMLGPIFSVYWILFTFSAQFSSVQFSHSVVSDSLWPHESQHARPPCPSPTPGVHSDSRPSSQRCHPAISSSVVPFSSCPQSLPASESFPVGQLFAWGSQSTGVSALESFLPKKSQGWFPSEWTGWISLQSKGLARVFSSATVQKHQSYFIINIISSYVLYGSYIVLYI